MAQASTSPRIPKAPVSTVFAIGWVLASHLIRPRKPSQHRLWRKVENLSPLVMQGDVTRTLELNIDVSAQGLCTLVQYFDTCELCALRWFSTIPRQRV